MVPDGTLIATDGIITPDGIMDPDGMADPSSSTAGRSSTVPVPQPEAAGPTDSLLHPEAHHLTGRQQPGQVPA